MLVCAQEVINIKFRGQQMVLQLLKMSFISGSSSIPFSESARSNSGTFPSSRLPFPLLCTLAGLEGAPDVAIVVADDTGAIEHILKYSSSISHWLFKFWLLADILASIILQAVDFRHSTMVLTRAAVNISSAETAFLQGCLSQMNCSLLAFSVVVLEPASVSPLCSSFISFSL